ncbi:LCP family protein [Sutcliffiella cohnii]|uniref:LCP family glycopolymer transferase n=1 Tax=Sutcliffiella cohnii TaxID=33932 RepID=UPI002E1A61CD|nr:LCP family protein [Sutcliffiella cohnii]
MRSERRQKKKMKKWVKVTLSILAVFVLLVGGYIGYTLFTLNKALTTMHDPLDRDFSALRTGPVDLSKKQPFSVLIMGIDKESGGTDRGRTDSLMVVTVNPADDSMKMMSIPRDTRVELVGRGTLDKINHAHAFGGVEMSIPTVEKFLDIPIDFYVKMNMEGFKDIVNAVGGVEVNNSFAFTQDKFTFQEGRISLNGDEALAFSRMRKQDPRGDFGRTDRQKQVVQGVINKGASVTGIANVNSLLGAIGHNVNTNLARQDMMLIQRNYLEARHNVDTLQLSGSGSTINGVYYFVVPEDERTRVSNIFKEHLNIN